MLECKIPCHLIKYAKKVIIFMTDYTWQRLCGGHTIITIDYVCEKNLDYTISFVWERYGKMVTSKELFQWFVLIR